MSRTSRISFAVALGLALAAGACRGKPPVSPTPPPGLDDAADQQAGAAAPGATKVGQTLRGVAHSEDETYDFHVPLDPKNCYVFGAVGEESVQKLGVYLYDPKDHRVESESGKGRTSFNYCPEVAGMFRVMGKVSDGRGHYAISIYASVAPPKPVPVADAPPPAPRSVDLAAMVEAEAKSTAPGSTRVGELFSGSAEQTEWFVSLDPGKCYWMIGVGEPGKVKELFLYLWDTKNSRLNQNKSDTNKVVVGHCPKAGAGGMHKFQVKVNSGSGAYKVGVYAKAAGPS